MSETTNIINTPPSADHDLLIELKTEMKGVGKVLQEVRNDIKEIKDNTALKIQQLAQDKLDKKEADDRMTHLEQSKQDKLDSQKVHGDHESRLRRLEYWGTFAIGALTLAEVAIQYFK